MRILQYGKSQTEQGKLFYDVLDDLQQRNFQLITELNLFHIVNRGRHTIRTVAVTENGLHFAIKKLSTSEKEGYKRQRIDADFLLVGMRVIHSQYRQSELMLNPKDEPLCTWPRVLYFAEEDVVEKPVLARDVAFISRVIMEHFLIENETIAVIERLAELNDAYKELPRKLPPQSDWD